ncbi:hypothetical protein, partial [Bifidobacterium bifidum]|uniref:hypothetical protein n=1 Tax=Bifidobacterium bifidum TaxID=1681 RepID=UPI0034A508E7
GIQHPSAVLDLGAQHAADMEQSVTTQAKSHMCGDRRLTFIGRMSHGIVLGDFCDVIVKHHAAIEFATCRAMPDDVMGDFIEQLAKQRHMIGVDVFHESIVVQREPSMESLAGKLFSKSVT